jgi:hypothetical protein
VKKLALAALFIWFLSFSNIAQAGLIFFVEEVGSNIKITASGSLDTTGWTSGNQPPGVTFLRQERVMVGTSAPSGTGFIEFGPLTSFSVSGGASSTNVFPSLGTGFYSAASHSGDLAGMRFDGSAFRVMAPVGYSSGNSISGTATFNNLSLTSLGMNSGTTWKWYFGANGDEGKSLTITAVPEPGSLIVVSGLVAGLSVLSRRRRES